MKLKKLWEVFYKYSIDWLRYLKRQFFIPKVDFLMIVSMTDTFVYDYVYLTPFAGFKGDKTSIK